MLRKKGTKMPDENKFIGLRRIGYCIRGTCVHCVHCNFNPHLEWGTCGLHHYEHKKHNNPDGGREISIHIFGSCRSFEVDPIKLAQARLGGHVEFFEGDGKRPLP